MLKIMTYNIAGGRDYTYAPDRVTENPAAHAEVISSYMPDIVGLNEVDEGLERSGRISVSGVIAETLGYNRLFAPAIGWGGGFYGNALLTKHKILSSEIIGIPDVIIRCEPVGYETRVILHAVVGLADGKCLDVFVTHFGLAAKERKNAVATLKKAIAKARNQVVLMGDFNLRPDDAILLPLRRILKNTGDALSENSVTFPSHSGVSDKSEGVIDYIFASKDMEVKNVGIIESRASDHKPYYAEFEF